jgi:hypothetical protein
MRDVFLFYCGGQPEQADPITTVNSVISLILGDSLESIYIYRGGSMLVAANIGRWSANVGSHLHAGPQLLRFDSIRLEVVRLKCSK